MLCYHLNNLNVMVLVQSLADANPLTTSRGSVWFKYFQQLPQIELIRIDLLRTHYEVPYFRRTSTQQMMERILLIWSAENAELGYRQGMNELLAMILIATSLDRWNHQPSNRLSSTMVMITSTMSAAR
jgi:hypothetical protein